MISYHHIYEAKMKAKQNMDFIEYMILGLCLLIGAMVLFGTI